MSKNIYTDLKIPIDSLHNLEGVKCTNLPQRIIKSLQEVKPDNILIVNEKPIVLFFHNENEILKKENGKQQVFKNCWNFAEAPIIIIENESDFEVYNGFEFIVENKSLDILPKKNLNYISILNGEYFSELKTQKQNKRIDTVLLENIKNAREILIIELAQNELQDRISKLYKEKNKDKKSKIYKTFSIEELKEFKALQNIANSLIGRIIFIRYLIDRKVSLKKYEESLSSNDDLKNILQNKEKTYKLFKYLKNTFNGDWFPIIEDKINNIFEEKIVNNNHLQILKELISGTELKVGMKTLQGSLFDIYNFSIIPIEFISNVYESFIGVDEQKNNGAYYTPTFLVDYILKYTVDEFFQKNPNTWNCKVLDPACGSGIFLVETLRKLVARFEKINERPIKENELKQLIKDNIFGIDKDENAISISVFSLYLAMLDYQNPKELDKFKFPHLLKNKNNSNPNFFVNDFFDVKDEYNQILKEKKLDFIIGNPPYGKGTINKSEFALNYVNQQFLNIGNKDIVQPFMVRVKDFVNENTKIGFIVTSKVLYNLQSKDFRTKYFFNTFKINRILELSSVRKEIFENANVPVSIVFYEYSSLEKIEKHIIKYISMKPNPYFKKLKILTLSKIDFKKVLQSKFLENDFLWKILVYGSYLDFNFLKRLQTYNKLSDFIHDANEGMMIGGGDKNSSSQYIGMPFIETKQITPFYVNTNDIKWEKEYVHRPRTLHIFQAPSLLVSKGISSKLDLKTGILHNDSVFTNSITSVHSENIDTLYSIMGILCSDFFRYYTIQNATSIGIEREQSYNEERFSVPFVENTIMIKLVKEIEQFYQNQNHLLSNEDVLQSLKTKLNYTIFELLNINEQEYALIDYANNVVIPWVIQKDYKIPFKKLKFKDKLIEYYLNVFIEHYSKIYNQNNMYFQVNILWDDYAIGIYFKVLNEKPNEIITWRKEKDIQNFLKISGNHTLENLFIQKDIKGFESDGFYVVKPNEYKNWHKAIGYLDFYEFNDAILKAGKNNWMN